MGGEGAAWIGLSRRSCSSKHVFQNIGDGTYFHSGLLAIRAAAAAGVDITYKILFNDAVAMTGGQPVDGNLTVPQITRQVAAEGAKRIVVVTDEPGQVSARHRLRAGRHRAPSRRARHRAARAARDPGPDRARLRPDLRGREAPAAQARPHARSAAARVHQRRRLRRLRRLLRPVELRVGQAAGNRVRPQAHDRPVGVQQGLLVREGLLPELRHRARRAPCAARRPRCRRPRCRCLRTPALDEPYAILVTGIGGTGVITIGALLGMAAHVEGTRLQRARLHRHGAEERRGDEPRAHRRNTTTTCTRCASAPARPISCSAATWSWRQAHRRSPAMEPGVTRAIVNATLTPTARFVVDRDMDLQQGPMQRALRTAAGADGVEFVAASQIATALDGRHHRDQPVPAGAMRSSAASCRWRSIRFTARSS